MQQHSQNHHQAGSALARIGEAHPASIDMATNHDFEFQHQLHR